MPVFDGPTADSPSEPDTTSQTFDPSSPRANYALYPLSNLLFCTECHEIRCPRCYFEEVLYYFCPQCLLETPSATVKSESNRCTRSCFQCPLCIAPLSLQSFASDETRLKPDQPAMRDGPFILSCPYCAWSTLDIGIKLEKSVNISGQLAQLKHRESSARAISDPTSRQDDFDETPAQIQDDNNSASTTDQFTALTAFYKDELPENAARNSLALGMSANSSSNFGLDSPSHLARLLSTFGVGGLKKQTQKPRPMREASDPSEGLIANEASEEHTVQRMKQAGWNGVTSILQRSQQQQQDETHFPPHLRPIATPLLTKRAKRCRQCRHQLIRPDDKRQSTRYKIRLLALNYIPRVAVKPLQPAANSSPSADSALPALKATQFTVRFSNPLFEPIKIHLATPPSLHYRTNSKVTILCPQFDVSASTDAWDEALAAPSGNGQRGDGQQIAEAGKVWEKGRNWTSVVLEVVPGTLPPPFPRTRAEAESGILGSDGEDDDDEAERAMESERERERVLEVPILVRTEYSTSDGADASTTGKGERTQRELQFWVVLGLGRVES